MRLTRTSFPSLNPEPHLAPFTVYPLALQASLSLMTGDGTPILGYKRTPFAEVSGKQFTEVWLLGSATSHRILWMVPGPAHQALLVNSQAPNQTY